MAGFLAFVTCSPPSRRDILTNNDSLDIIGFTNILQQSTPLTACGLPEVSRPGLVPRAARMLDHPWEGSRCNVTIMNLEVPVNFSDICKFLLFQLMKQLVSNYLIRSTNITYKWKKKRPERGM